MKKGMNKYIFRNAKEVLLVNILAAAAAGFAALLPYITAELVERIGAFSGGTAVRFALYYIGAVAGILVFMFLLNPILAAVILVVCLAAVAQGRLLPGSMMKRAKTGRKRLTVITGLGLLLKFLRECPCISSTSLHLRAV